MGVWIPIRDGDQQLNTVISQSNVENVDFSILLNGFTCDPIYSDGKNFHRISFPEGYSFREPGAPDIMRIRKLVAIPQCDKVTLSIVECDYSELDNYLLSPVPTQNTNSDQNGLFFSVEQYVYNTNDYLSSAFYPTQIVELGEIGFFRGQKFAEVFIYPLSFNPLTEQIRFYTDINIRLKFTEPTSPLIINTGIYNGSASSTFINYPSNGISAIINDRSNREGIVNYCTLTSTTQADYLMADYLIIADDQFYNSAVPPVVPTSLNRIAQHRAAYNGFYVSVVNVENIRSIFDPGSGQFREARAIREFIRRVYMGANAPNMGDDHLGYVLLVGDVIMDDGSQGVYTSYDTPYEGFDWTVQLPLTPIPSDHYYCLVSGTDNLGDLSIGRFSASNEAELHNIVLKTMNYEQIYGLTPWRNNTVFRYGEIFNNLNDNFQTYSLYSNHFTNILSHEPYQSNYHSYFYANDPEYANTTALINQGCMYGLLMSHGYVNMIGDNNYILEAGTYINGLNNATRNPNLFIDACLTGAFDYPNGDCLTETFLNGDPAKGFATTIGCSKVSSGSSLLIQGALYWRYAQSIWNRRLFVSGEAYLTAKNLCNNDWDRHAFGFMGDPGLNLMASGYQVIEQMAYTEDAVITTEIEVMPGATLHFGTEMSTPVQIRFEQNGRLIVHEGATLNIHNGTQVEIGDINSIGIYGNLVIGQSINFVGYDYEPGSLHIMMGTPNIAIDSVGFEKMIIKTTRSNTSIQNCDINNSSVIISGTNSIVNLNDFVNSPLYIFADGNKSFGISVTNNQFVSSPVDFENVASFYIANNTFQNVNIFPYPNAINLFHSGWRPNSLHAVLSNIVGGDTENLFPFEIGINVFNSHVDINNNFFKNNKTCIKSLNGSSCSVVGNNNATNITETQRFILNQNPRCAIWADHVSFPYQTRWNHFTNNNTFTPDEWLVCWDENHTYSRPHNVTYNNWSQFFQPVINVNPAKFVIEPFWSLHPVYGEGILVEDMFTQAINNKLSGNYTLAETQLKFIIENYPEDKYAEVATKELLPLSAIIYENLNALKIYYANIDVFSASEELLKVANQYKVLCDLIDKNYVSAINAYENIIQNSGSFSDSLYAAIDLCMTYLLMMNDPDKGAVVVKFPNLRPNSYDEYLAMRKLMFNNISSQDHNHEVIADNTDIKTYPNPFNPIINFEITTPKVLNTDICLYNIRGQLVKRIKCENLQKGKNTVIWNGRDSNNNAVSSGIYVYKVSTPEGLVSGKITMVK